MARRYAFLVVRAQEIRTAFFGDLESARSSQSALRCAAISYYRACASSSRLFLGVVDTTDDVGLVPDEEPPTNRVLRAPHS